VKHYLIYNKAVNCEESMQGTVKTAVTRYSDSRQRYVSSVTGGTPRGSVQNHIGEEGSKLCLTHSVATVKDRSVRLV